jgi:hypothetical protein
MIILARVADGERVSAEELTEAAKVIAASKSRGGCSEQRKRILAARDHELRRCANLASDATGIKARAQALIRRADQYEKRQWARDQATQVAPADPVDRAIFEVMIAGERVPGLTQLKKILRT